MKKKENKVEEKEEVTTTDKKKEVIKKSKQKASSLYKEFKKFISRGNVVDMSIGVVIGTAFGAIVTALTNIFLNLATWGVPGGLKGLITVLPALNESQAGMKEIGQSFLSSDLNNVAQMLFEKYKDVGTYTSISDARNAIISKYTLHGGIYVSNGAAIIDWGTMINAILTFIVIALVLFAIIKTVAKLNQMREEAKKKLQEEYYKKHPDERPIPVNPKEPELTEQQLLKQILLEIKDQKNKQVKSIKKK